MEFRLQTASGFKLSEMHWLESKGKRDARKAVDCFKREFNYGWLYMLQRKQLLPSVCSTIIQISLCMVKSANCRNNNWHISNNERTFSLWCLWTNFKSAEKIQVFSENCTKSLSSSILLSRHHDSNWLIKFSDESDIENITMLLRTLANNRKREKKGKKNEESSTRNKAISILLLNKSYIVSIDCRNGPFNKRHNVGIHFGRELSARFRSLHVKSSYLPVVSFISNFISYRILFLHQMEIGRAAVWRHAEDLPSEKFYIGCSTATKKTVKDCFGPKTINKFWLVPEFALVARKGSEISRCPQDVPRMLKEKLERLNCKFENLNFFFKHKIGKQHLDKPFKRCWIWRFREKSMLMHKIVIWNEINRDRGICRQPYLWGRFVVGVSCISFFRQSTNSADKCQTA